MFYVFHGNNTIIKVFKYSVGYNRCSLIIVIIFSFLQRKTDRYFTENNFTIKNIFKIKRKSWSFCGNSGGVRILMASVVIILLSIRNLCILIVPYSGSIGI